MPDEINNKGIKIDEDKIITFINGIMGLEKYKKYILLDHPGTNIVKWLQSVEEPQIALPVADPLNFFPSYEPKFSKQNLEQIKIKSNDEILILCVLTIPKDVKGITINLKAPIIINVNLRLADQFIAENPELNIREPLNLAAFADRRCNTC